MGCSLPCVRPQPSLANKVSVAAAAQPLIVSGSPIQESSTLAKYRLTRKQNKINGRPNSAEQVMHENAQVIPGSKGLLDTNRGTLSNILRNHFFFGNIL